MTTADEPKPTDAAADGGETETPKDVPDFPTPALAVTPAPVPASGRGLRQVLPVAGVTAAYLVVFGLVVGLGWQLWQQHRYTAAAAAGQRAAVAYAQVLTSIDSEKVDDDFDAVLNGATGDFKDTYSKASRQLRQLLIDNKATSQGTVVDSAVQSGNPDTVVVLLMVNQSVTNTTRPDPRVDRFRMKMTMQHVDGRWLASKVEMP